ncbi:MAG: hypothetical protein ACXV8Q_00440 [Methylobacter sp.]
MQTQTEQALKNISRLSAYRAKQTEDQRQRAALAERVNDYSKKLGLNVTQRSVAVKMALKQLDFGVSDDDAYKTGINAARTIALVSANERITCNRRRFSISLH